MMTQITDITIIGSGIIGLLTAKQFVKNGISVTLIDKSLSGQEASWAGGGILLPLYPWRQSPAISQLVMESLKQYPLLSDELLEATGIDPEWYDCGLLICKNPDYQLATDWCKQYQITYTNADNHFFARLNTEPDQPLWLPNIAQVRNPRLLKSLKAYLLNSGVTFIENCEVIDCSINNNKITRVLTNRGKINVNRLILCSGAWTGTLIKKLLPAQAAPDISPVKGQMLLFNAEPDTLAHIVLDDGHYLIPRKDGRILAGSSVEQHAFDKNPTAKTRDKLFSFATRLLPALKHFPVAKHWAGLRPGTQQGIPYIGQHPVIKNLNINAGQFRNGLVMGPASARLMTDLILQKTPCVDPEPYRLNRSQTN